jgi:hypothetical protein
LPTPIKPISIDSSSVERFLQIGIIVSVSALRVKVRQYSKNLYAERGEAADGSRPSHLDGMAIDSWLPAASGWCANADQLDIGSFSIEAGVPTS